MPDRHRAAALRLAWARRQLARGLAVWDTPAIHTWDAWLTRQWRAAAQRGAVQPAQLLDVGQERVLWEMVLARLAGEGEDATTLTQHAGALMQSAARVTQSGIDPARLAQSREESLLATALDELRRECAARGLLSLRLATASALDFLAQVPAPLIAGEQKLTALQAAVAARCWPGVPILVDAPARDASPMRLLRAADLEQELQACAHWCRAHVERDAGARLLVLSACIEPSLPIQGALLWRALAQDAQGDEVARARWLAVEGGEPLLHQALCADALQLLQLAAATQIEAAVLRTLLCSPYLALAPDAVRLRLAAWIDAQGLAEWEYTGLQDALRQAGDREPAAAVLTAWLAAAREQLGITARADATEWARRFSAVLDAAGFARAAQLDSREQQRLARWHELLDEFAALDAVLPALDLQGAVRRLGRLAGQARHQAASADAAITLSADLGDPVVGYDGIWVLGLAEHRWPAAPRPDAWVALAEQRRAGWVEAGVSLRREQALWALAGWRRRGAELVLSFPASEGDLSHRPTALAGDVAAWTDWVAVPALPEVGQAPDATDQQLARLETGQGHTMLKGGAGRLATQQACPFRAQAQYRLGAEPPAMLSAGVPPALRGRLLHLLLEHLWQELADHSGLLALDPDTQQTLLARCWTVAIGLTPAARWLPLPVLERERARAFDTVARVLDLERSRPPFTVKQRESTATWTGAGAHLSLRIDRIDETQGEAVLIDYKSGAPTRIQLQEDALEPLQLAVYAAALAQQDHPVSAAALLNLHPYEPGFSGVTARAGLLADDLHDIEDWSRTQQQWQQQLLALMEQHLSGEATLTRDRKVCARCHLPALCRRAGADVLENSDE